MSKLPLARVDRRFAGYIFDLDGTIWMTDQLIAGANETVAALRSQGACVRFLTNNSDGTREMFAAQLRAMGLYAEMHEVLGTSYVTARYLNDKAPGAHCYVIGHDPLREELCAAGLRLRDRPGDIDYVVLGVDRDFSYRKLQTAFEAIRSGARFLATNPDLYVPTARGDLADIGSMIAAIETATGHPLDVLIGKPNPLMVEMALDLMGMPKQDCLLVGDQLTTDVLAGLRAGVPVALLLRDPRVVEQLAVWPELPAYGLNSLPELVV